jgi:hypothetical protein
MEKVELTNLKLLIPMARTVLESWLKRIGHLCSEMV